ncbi:MAG: DUF2479 domain-containing protein [Coriobacteriaceae bacterium]|nr:DUF2479 domain-containing protein [Coriobacteriaceae bacterium]
MLDSYGLHELVWDACDERFSDILVASPADAGGRGISLAVREGGAAADMTGATLYLALKNKVTGARGTEPFQAVDASAGTFTVFYPAAMCEAAGAVQAQVVVSRGDDTYISSRAFTIKVEPVVIKRQRPARRPRKCFRWPRRRASSSRTSSLSPFPAAPIGGSAKNTTGTDGKVTKEPKLVT